MEYDTVIVGGGPAGLVAGIYAARHGLSVLIMAREIGGRAKDAAVIENYPGFERITGMELMERFYNQAKKEGCEFVHENATEIKKEKVFAVVGENREFSSACVIYATGISRRKLGVPGEDLNGVSYCATCDAPLYRGKNVAVIGGGNSALTSALILSEVAKKVFLVHRRDEFRAEKKIVEKVRAKENVSFHLGYRVIEINGERKVESITIDKNGERKLINVDGVFINVGGTPNSELALSLGVKTDDKGYIIVDEYMRSNVSGFLAAGDVVRSPLKQIVTAAAQGAIAGSSAYRYIKGEI